MRGLTLSLILIFGCKSGLSQTYQHGTFWSRIVLNKAINKKLTLTSDLMYRRQNDNLNSITHIFNRPLVFSQRIGINYRPKNWQTGFSVAHFKSSPLLGTEKDKSRPANNEWRYTIGSEYFKSFKRHTFQWRTQYEYRSLQDRIAGRFRTRIGTQVPISKANRIQTTLEGLWSAPPKINTRKFDQSQFAFLLLHRFNKHVDSEIGYRFNYRKRRTTYEIDLENALTCGLIFRY